VDLFLTPELDDFVREMVESERYNSRAEVVREALLLLRERERVRDLRLEELRREIQKGIDSGPPVDGAEVFARLRAKYEAMVADAETTDAALPLSA
jgi:antitoxin ParD1/3/4